MARFNGRRDPDGVFRPVLFPYVFVKGTQPSRWRAIVDSGADRTVVSLQLVQALTGQDWKDLRAEQDFIGLSGPEETRQADLEVAWPTADRVLCSNVVVVRAEIPVLLGRRDFFSRYVVRFGWHHNPPTFDVDPVPPPLPPGTRPVGPGKRRKGKRRK